MPIVSGGGGGGGGSVTLITSSTLLAPAASLDFQAIAGTFNHLWLVACCRTDSAAVTDSVLLRFNNDSAANYDRETISGINVTTASAPAAGGTSIYVGNCAASTATAAHFGTLDILIPGYATANSKMLRSICGSSPVAGTATNWEGSIQTGLWRSTAAIIRVTLIPSVGTNFATGSFAFLYGQT